MLEHNLFHIIWYSTRKLYKAIFMAGSFVLILFLCKWLSFFSLVRALDAFMYHKISRTLALSTLSAERVCQKSKTY